MLGVAASSDYQSRLLVLDPTPQTFGIADLTRSREQR